MTHLSWDESRPCVLGMARALCGRGPGHAASRLRDGDGEYLNEPYQHFPPGHGRADPDGRDCVWLAPRWRNRRRLGLAAPQARRRRRARPGDRRPCRRRRRRPARKSPADAPVSRRSRRQPAPPPPAAAVQTADPFGEQFTLEPKKVVVIKGTANWDSAFDTLIDSFKALTALLDKQGIKATGNSMIVYTSTDDTGFTFLAEIPVDQEPKNLTKDMSIGKSPEGKALKFVHRGSYDNMDNTYEAITNHLDDKKLEAKDTFIEEYITDPLKTAEDKLVINVYVPLK